MADVFLRKYAKGPCVIPFSLFEVDGVDFRVDAVAASGDAKIMKDEGSLTTTTRTFVDEGQTYSIALTTTEVTAARVSLEIVDLTGTKAWLDKHIVIETYGNASAQHVFDLGASTVQVGGTSKTGYSLAASSLTSGTFAAGAVNAAALSPSAGSEIGTAVWATGTRAITDKAGFSLAASSVTSGTFAAGAVNAAALSGSAVTEIAAGISAATQNANLVEIMGTAVTEAAGTLAGSFSYFMDVASPAKTINDCGVAGSGLSAADVWAYGARSVATVTLLATGSLTSTSFAAGALNAAAVSGSAGTELGTAVWATAARALTDKAGFSLAASSITSGTLAAGALNAAALSGSAGSEIGTAVWATGTRVLTAGTNLNDFDPSADTVHLGASALADVQGEVTTALNTYDPPTTAEMNARTLVAASYFDPAADTVHLGASALADVQGECDSALATYDAPTNAEMNARTLVAASYFDPSTDTIQVGGTSKTGYSLAASSVTSGTLAAGAVNAAALSSTAGEKLADIAARRTLANIEASSDGDALSLRSQYGAASKLVNKIAISGTTLSVYRTNDSTVLGTQAVTTNVLADPISGLDTD